MPVDERAEGELYALALDKMTSVLGRSRAATLMEKILDSTGITLAEPDDLFLFSAELAKYGGFEGAVGGLLNVQAVMRGGRRRRPAAG